jgi:hypothetical protein
MGVLQAEQQHKTAQQQCSAEQGKATSCVREEKWTVLARQCLNTRPDNQQLPADISAGTSA